MRTILLAVAFLFGTTGSVHAAMRDLVLPALQLDAKGKTKESTYKLIDIVGRKPIVFVYWVPSVAASVDELKRLDAFAKNAGKSPVVFLSAARVLDANERAAVERVMRDAKISIPVLLDANMVLAQEMQAQFLPVYHGLDAKGEVAVRGFSSLSEPTLQGANLEISLAGAKDIPHLTPITPRPLKPGDVAPDFALPGLDGEAYRLSDALKAGKPTLLVFWSAACPHCQKELPRIQKFLDARKQPFTVLSVTRILAEQERVLTSTFVTNHGITFPVLADGGAVLQRYHVEGIPMWMIVNEKGRILTVHTGEQKTLEALLSRYAK